MKTKTTLASLYSFPGFKAMANLKGIYGDPESRIITLKRRQKKRFAPAVGKAYALIMIQSLSVFVICLLAVREYILSLNKDVLAVKAVRP